MKRPEEMTRAEYLAETDGLGPYRGPFREEEEEPMFEWDDEVDAEEMTGLIGR